MSVKIMIIAALSAAILFGSHTGNAATFTSGNEKVQLVELFSSQGCSSCPPAQRYLNRYTQSPQLWSDFVPVVFHVDYWDYLGWKDPYSSADFSTRQRQYRRQGRANSVYTPGFFVQGNEWTGFFQRRSLPQNTQSAPELKVTLEDNKLTASFDGHATESLQLNVAVLGMNLSTNVRAGENRNRTLKENFIVLEHFTINSKNGRWESDLTLPQVPNELALATWVTRKGSLEPLQATGGYIQ